MGGWMWMGSREEVALPCFLPTLRSVPAGFGEDISKAMRKEGRQPNSILAAQKQMGE